MRKIEAATGADADEPEDGGSQERLEALDNARFLAEMWHETCARDGSPEEWTRMSAEIVEHARAAGLSVDVPEPADLG